MFGDFWAKYSGVIGGFVKNTSMRVKVISCAALLAFITLCISVLAIAQIRQMGNSIDVAGQSTKVLESMTKAGKSVDRFMRSHYEGEIKVSHRRLDKIKKDVQKLGASDDVQILNATKAADQMNTALDELLVSAKTIDKNLKSLNIASANLSKLSSDASAKALKSVNNANMEVAIIRKDLAGLDKQLELATQIQMNSFQAKLMLAKPDIGKDTTSLSILYGYLEAIKNNGEEIRALKPSTAIIGELDSINDQLKTALEIDKKLQKGVPEYQQAGEVEKLGDAIDQAMSGAEFLRILVNEVKEKALKDAEKISKEQQLVAKQNALLIRFTQELSAADNAITKYRFEPDMEGNRAASEKIGKVLLTMKDLSKFGLSKMEKVAKEYQASFAALAKSTGVFTITASFTRDQVDEGSKAITQLVAARAENASAVVSRSQGMMIVAMILAIGLAAGVAFFIEMLVSRPIVKMTGVMRELAAGNTNVASGMDDRGDEIGDMGKTIEVFRDNALERVKLEENNREEQQRQAERQKRMEDMIDKFDSDVQQLLSTVNDNSEIMEQTAQALNGIADDTAERADSASNASEEASSGVQTVASTTEELASSISEINRQVGETKTIVTSATNAAHATSEKMASLDGAAQKIGEVVNLIQDIAEQTNLLALNATIEAARAGESGKGFSVVASEVKTLANQTANATQEISQQITDIQNSSKEAVSAIEEIVETMQQADSFTSEIVHAVDEQSSATVEISRSAQQAVSGTQNVASDMDNLKSSVAETNQSAAQVLSASHSLSQEAVNLRTTISDFLNKVKAA